MDKEKKKFLRRSLGWVSLNFSFFLVKFFPLKVAINLGDFIGRLGFLFSRRHRRIALESLSIALGREKSETQLKDIARQSFKFMGRSGLELFCFLRNSRLLKEKVEIVGEAHLNEALRKGRGLIGVTAHFGNFPLMCLKLAQQGYPVNVMARPMRDKKADYFFYQLRTQAKIKTIFSYPRKEAVFNSLKALRKNEILILQMDQNFGTGGVWVKFFGKLAATPVGPIILALRSEAPLIPLFIIEEARNYHKIYIEEELPLLIKEDKEETVLVNAIRITEKIETWIRGYPHLWSWIHRRWKSQPSEKVYFQKFKVQKD